MKRSRREILGWFVGAPLAAVAVPALASDRAIAALKAADAERLYNYAASSAVELVGLAPKAPFLEAADAYSLHLRFVNRAGEATPVRPYSREYAEE